MRSYPLPVADACAGPTIGTLFADAAQRYPDNIAIRFGDRRISYSTLEDRAKRLANWLLNRGLERGARIAILSENRPEYLEVVLACAKIGLIAACQNWRQSVPELTHCINLVEPDILFCSPRYREVAASLSLGDVTLCAFGPEYEAGLEASSAVEPGTDVHAEEGLLILYTSGTTGLPKGALISHRAMIARGMAMMVD